MDTQPRRRSDHNVGLTLASTWWVYTHDLSGDIIHDYGNFADRLAAELVAVTILDTAGFDMDTMVVRLVDATDPGNAVTIWMAAPMAYINEAMFIREIMRIQNDALVEAVAVRYFQEADDARR